MNKTKTILINGVKYAPVKSAKTTKKAVKSPELELKDFMAGVGFKPVSVVETTYTRKNGTKVPAKQIVYSNRKSYMVTENRFWKIK